MCYYVMWDYTKGASRCHMLKVADSIYARKLGPKWVHGAPKRPVTDPQTAWLTSPLAQLADTDPLAGWGDKKFSAGNS